MDNEQMINGQPIRSRRSLIPSMFVLARKNLEEALDRFSNKVKDSIFNVKVQNDKAFYNTLLKINQTLQIIQRKIGVPVKVDMPQANFNIKVPGDQHLENLSAQLKYLFQHIDELIQRVNGFNVKFPDKQQIEGVVKVANQVQFPKVELLSALTSVSKGLKAVETKIENLQLVVPAPKVEVAAPAIQFPKIPEGITPKEFKQMTDLLSSIKEELHKLPSKLPEAIFPDTINIGNFPPQKVPQPVTNININPLRGYAKSRNITVGTTPTPLPDEVLAFRRSLIIYNNSTGDLYVGGQDVSSTNGLIVPTESYSPVIDAGPKLIIYGIVASGTADARVFEVSNENIGG